MTANWHWRNRNDHPYRRLDHWQHSARLNHRSGDCGCEVSGYSEIIIPWMPKELSPNARVHWAKKSKIAKKYREDSRLSTLVCVSRESATAMRSDVEQGAYLFLVLNFFCPDKRHRDDDNLIASLKAARDGISDALGIDDKHFRIGYTTRQEPIKGGMVLIEISSRFERTGEVCGR